MSYEGLEFMKKGDKIECFNFYQKMWCDKNVNNF